MSHMYEDTTKGLNMGGFLSLALNLNNNQTGYYAFSFMGCSGFTG